MSFESIAPNERRYLLYAIDVDLDLDAQFYAIQSLLAANHNADRELTRHIESLVNEAKSVAGEHADLVVDEWVDSLYRSTYQDAAHSLAAVGMLAPFLESVLAQSFHALGQKLSGRVAISHPRFTDGGRQQWDCRRYRGESGKWWDGVVKGTMQLSEAIGLAPHLPEATEATLSALFEYRNRNFHNGLEWPMDARLEFLELVEANGWKEWFDKSESDHKPKIIYMSEAFTDHCVKFSGDLLDGLGAFVWEASQDGRIQIGPSEPPPSWITE